MSVVVRMEMPQGCFCCPIQGFNSHGVSVCGIGRKSLDRIIIGKPDFCPILCQLPEGHGRLGDLDELGRKINGARIRVMQDGQDTNPYWECGDIIASEKTIVPAERSET